MSSPRPTRKPKTPTCSEWLTLGDHGHFPCTLPLNHEGKHQSWEDSADVAWLSGTTAPLHNVTYHVEYNWTVEDRGLTEVP